MIAFETHPTQYHHWKLEVTAPLATLTLDIQADAGLFPGYTLKNQLTSFWKLSFLT